MLGLSKYNWILIQSISISHFQNQSLTVWNLNIQVFSIVLWSAPFLESFLDPRRSCLDPRRSCLDPRRSCLDPRRSCLDPRRSCLEPARLDLDKDIDLSTQYLKESECCYVPHLLHIFLTLDQNIFLCFLLDNFWRTAFEMESIMGCKTSI